MNLFGLTIEPEQFALILGVLLAVSEILGSNPKFKSNSIFQIFLNLLRLAQSTIVKKKPIEVAKDELIEEIKKDSEEKVEDKIEKVEDKVEGKPSLEELKAKLDVLVKEEEKMPPQVKSKAKPKTKSLKPKRK